jgi:hypothetical protein
VGASVKREIRMLVGGNKMKCERDKNPFGIPYRNNPNNCKGEDIE